MTNSIPPTPSAPVEKKVTWATVGAYLGSLAALAVLQAVSADANLISGLPDWLEVILIPIIPTLVTFVSGWTARHTVRPDLNAS